MWHLLMAYAYEHGSAIEGFGSRLCYLKYDVNFTTMDFGKVMEVIVSGPPFCRPMDMSEALFSMKK